ncbi:MAG: hypothetical protein M3022_11450 [Actinomycetota bacterium]|nr:hypothetical protein [Actinomycetota bacterium]
MRACLTGHHLRVVGGAVNADSRGQSGATGELIVKSAFIAFYPSAAVAARHAGALRTNATRLHGSISRHGNVTVLYVQPALASDELEHILRCLKPGD